MIVKFAGCYHGHADSLLVKAGSGAMTFGVPDSPEVPAALARHTLTVPFNNLAAVRQALEQHPGQVACVIVEPAAEIWVWCLLSRVFWKGCARSRVSMRPCSFSTRSSRAFAWRMAACRRSTTSEPDLTALGR